MIRLEIIARIENRCKNNVITNQANPKKLVKSLTNVGMGASKTTCRDELLERLCNDIFTAFDTY